MLLQSVERELVELYMAINANKSCSMRAGPRFDVTCRSITSLSGVKIPSVDQMRYLGVFIVQSCLFKCSLDNAKKAFTAVLTPYLLKLEELLQKKSHLK